MSVTLYTSPSPKLVLAGLRLLAVKSFLAATGGAVALRHALTGSAPPLTEALSSVGALPRDYALAAGLFAFSLAAGGYSVSAASRVVTALSASPADAAALRPAPALAGGAGAAALAAARAAAVVRVTTCSLGGGARTFSARAGDIEGASARASTQGFVLCPRGASWLRERRYFVFPVEPHWRSEDLPALRSLLFATHFREGEARAVELGRAPRVSAPALAAGIAGFGPFRPAAFADPHGAGRAALLPPSPGDTADGSAPANLPAGARWKHGEVWADFVVPPPPSLAARRERELREKAGVALAHGENADALPSVPKIEAPLPAAVAAAPPPLLK